MSKITQNYLLSLYFQLNIMVISLSISRLDLHFIYDLNNISQSSPTSILFISISKIILKIKT